ncbi:MAG: SDR family NAD(P)-dependent oxidoreductase [Proteobacteria bacterium]|nr:SDR family NAD(P)-dependent oxidoreductase [Pseudomonadota bacterium]
MDKKIILITGATDGIGKETATTLAKQGHHIIVHGRNEKKAQDVAAEIKRITGNDEIEIAIADLLSFKAIKTMADGLCQKHDHLDILINNAGAVFSKDLVLTEDGEERTFQLNAYAPFLLTHLLLPLLQKSPSARVIFESSAAHGVSRKPDFNDMKCEKKYDAQGNYCLSKLYVIWVMQHFAKYLAEKNIGNITMNATHPGMVMTKFGQNEKKGFIVDLIYSISYKLGLGDTIEDGAKSEIYLATSSEVEKITGKFYSNKCKLEIPKQKHYSEENEKAIWDYCMKICKPFMGEYK